MEDEVLTSKRRLRRQSLSVEDNLHKHVSLTPEGADAEDCPEAVEELKAQLRSKNLLIEQLTQELERARGERETLADFFKREIPDQKELILAGKIGERTVPLSTSQLSFEQTPKPVYLSSSEGMGIYRQSLCLLMAVACRRLWPTRPAVRVEHGFGLESSMLARAYYCEHPDYELTEDDVKDLERKMQELVEADLPFLEERKEAEQAIAFFKTTGQTYSAEYLQSRSWSVVEITRCEDYYVLAHRSRYRLVGPSTGFLKQFSLLPQDRGLTLRFPVTGDNGSLTIHPFTPIQIVADSYAANNKWAAILDVDSVGDINTMVAQGKSRELVHLCEVVQDSKINDICKQITDRRDEVRLVLVGGPSSSGKTTFAAKLRLQLTAHGFRPIMFSTDDYYRSGDDPDYPLLPNGEQDFEDINALRLDLLNEHLTRLLAGEEVETPVFDFITRKPKAKGRTLKLPSNGVLIAEGIFCLNNELTKTIKDQNKFRVFISSLSQLNLDELHYMNNQLWRLVRRISRDYIHRGRAAAATIRRWPSVRSGEERNIFPFIGEADAVFNSAADYELGVLKVYVQPLLEDVQPGTEEHNTAVQILGLLQMFHPIPEKYVPSTAIVREFLGASDFEDE